MDKVTLRLTDQQINMINWFVEMGEFPSTSEAIRTAIREMIDSRSQKLIPRMELMKQVQERAKDGSAYIKMNG